MRVDQFPEPKPQQMHAKSCISRAMYIFADVDMSSRYRAEKLDSAARAIQRAVRRASLRAGGDPWGLPPLVDAPYPDAIAIVRSRGLPSICDVRYVGAAEAYWRVLHAFASYDPSWVDPVVYLTRYVNKSAPASYDPSWVDPVEYLTREMREAREATKEAGESKQAIEDVS